jgi:hypothetical protein
MKKTPSQIKLNNKILNHLIKKRRSLRLLKVKDREKRLNFLDLGKIRIRSMSLTSISKKVRNGRDH